jgi:hypothetical protein
MWKGTGGFQYRRDNADKSAAMRVLVACEFSGIVRDAFIAKGHDAISCDLLPSERPGPHLIMESDMHLKDTVYNRRRYGWDMLIYHPPCTRLTNSCIWYIKKHNLWEEVRQAAIFFNMLEGAPIKKRVGENPIQHGEARKYIRMYDQVIQPYNFGENASKATCLWLDGLPRLVNTEYYPPRLVDGKKRWANQTDGGWNKLGPADNRGMERSRTYPGIARAMAEQWG